MRIRFSLLFTWVFYMCVAVCAKAQTSSPVASQMVPDQERFTKTNLFQGQLYEPTEMTILPNLDILIVQRRGAIALYKQESKKLLKAGFLPAYFKSHTTGVNAEEGVLGIQADPDFAVNHFVYIYYSPLDTSVNRLSRFHVAGDSVEIRSERIILQLYSQREICCHTGGSIAFGQDRQLFVSTGDNTTPFNESRDPKAIDTHNFAPLDDRPGQEHLHYDSRRSAGNTNDLRGKILRIHLNEDGTYTIPEGNLFSPGQEKTKPEIYVMGDRNPYRISIDKKNNYLYWGEVGPDAPKDSLETRGPMGYDEVNQARKAGNFGWPLFVANNIPYHAYDYATGRSGAAFDPQHPINDSRNNTGLRELPAAQPAFIWYPYGNSTEFPQVGSGGRTAMAGPVYYPELYSSDTRMPDYYAGKLFIYDWVRGWIKAITMNAGGDYAKMEPFMEHTKFNSPVDMEMGPDGKLYILEYGTGWFTANKDAGLARIDFNVAKPAPAPSTFTLKRSSHVMKNLKVANKHAPALKGALNKRYAAGEHLFLSMDCRSCHKTDESSVGPAFNAVAAKYKTNREAALTKLSAKIINGGGGVWGDVMMPAHPNLKPSDAKLIVHWILSLTAKK